MGTKPGASASTSRHLMVATSDGDSGFSRSRVSASYDGDKLHRTMVPGGIAGGERRHGAGAAWRTSTFVKHVAPVSTTSPSSPVRRPLLRSGMTSAGFVVSFTNSLARSEEHTSELQSP